MKNEKNEKSYKNGNDFWKFNSCLICDALYDDKRKKFLTKNQKFKKMYGKRPNKMGISEIRNSKIHY